MKKQDLSAASKYYKEAETKSNTELIDEIIFMADNSTPDDIDTDKVLAYLGMLDERAPIEESHVVDEEKTWERIVERAKMAQALNDLVPESVQREKRAPHTLGIIRKTLIALAAAVVLLSAIAFASGENPFELVIKKAGDLIFFAQNPSGELELPEGVEGEYRSLREALDANGMEDALCPKWIPKGYTLENVRVKETSRVIKISAFYYSEQGSLVVAVSDYPIGTDNSTFETEIDDCTEYSYNGNSYYISNNQGITQSYGRRDTCAYSIWGDITEHEMEMVIQSLYR